MTTPDVPGWYPVGQVSLRFAAGHKRRNLCLAMTALGLLGTGALALLGRDAADVWACLAGTAFQGLSAGVMGRFGVVLTASGITLRGWTTRYYPWGDVRAVEAVNFLGARRTRVRLIRGTKPRTWAPYDDFLLTDLAFDQKVEAMQRWHAFYGWGEGTATDVPSAAGGRSAARGRSGPAHLSRDATARSRKAPHEPGSAEGGMSAVEVSRGRS